MISEDPLEFIHRESIESSSPATTTPSSPALRTPESTQFQASTPLYPSKKLSHSPISISQVATSVGCGTSPSSTTYGEPTLTPPPRSPAGPPLSAGDGKSTAPDGTSSDKSSETAVGLPTAAPAPLSRKESYKAQRQHYRREKKRAATALLHSIEDPSVVVLADWLKVRGSLKSWTKLWCVLKPGLLLLYKSPKAKSSHWVGTVLLTSCQVIERPSKKDGFCFKLYHPLEQSIWAPRGPHNETIGAVVQPLPTAHLIFRASSSAAGHWWLDGLELALRSSNAMLRCSRAETETVTEHAPITHSDISHEELEKHFNEQELEGAASDSDSDTPVMAAAGETNKRAIIQRLESTYEEDLDKDTGAAGEQVEEITEENKSLIWFILKQVRPGMDLSKVVLPTFILEPRSFLDKLSDTYFHADILATAQTQEDPYIRFKTVLRWYLSGLYRKPKGLKKPYNPVLGEAFRCCWIHPNNTRTFYVAEQVSHHPPVSAFYVSNRKEGFVIEGSLLARSKFYGNSTSAILEGSARVHLLKWNETYITTAPYAHCKGIVIGTLSMELGGKVQILCPDTGYSADIEFKLRGFLGGSDQTNAVSGRIRKGKETVASIDGYWDWKIDIKEKKTGEESTFVDCQQLKLQRLPRYLVKLNNQTEYESQKLWEKVSDAIRNDDQVAATEQKTIIEEAQRVRARSLLSVWMPRCFHIDPNTRAPEGIIDQGWHYNYLNTEPWHQTEVIEYEENFVIKSITSGGEAITPRASMGESHLEHTRATDSDSHDDVRPAQTTARTLKQSLHAIDMTLKEQKMAIDKLTRTVEVLYEEQATTARPQNLGRMPPASHSWELFTGFVLAMVLQALLSWMFYQKD